MFRCFAVGDRNESQHRFVQEPSRNQQQIHRIDGCRKGLRIRAVCFMSGPERLAVDSVPIIMVSRRRTVRSRSSWFPARKRALEAGTDGQTSIISFALRSRP